MAQFDVDFSESLSQVAEFQLRLLNMGKSLDALEKKSGKSTAAGQLLKSMTAEYTKLEDILIKAGADATTLGKTMEGVRAQTNLLLSGIAANNLKATVTAKAYNGEMMELARLLNDTASKNTYSAWQQKTAQLTNKMAAENGYLRASIAEMDSVLAKDNANLRANLAHKQALVTADQRLRNSGDMLTLTYAGLSKEQGQSNVMTQAYIAAKKSQITEEIRLDAQLKTAERTLASLNGGQQEQIAKVQQVIAARKAEITENQRLETTLATLARQMESLSGGQQEQVVRQQALVAARKAEIAEDIRLDATLQTLQRALAGLTGGQQEQITRTEQMIAARKKQISEDVNGKKAINELEAAMKREEAQLTRLQAQSSLMSTGYAQRLQAVKAQITEQERYNKVLAMTTRELLGFTAAQTRANLAQEAGSQATAMLRAGLSGLKASVGMYTSATVLAATATYGITAALRDSIITGAEFEATMSRAQAVMSTNGPGWIDTKSQTKALNEEVRALGQTTVFTASEVAEGLQQIGQAGLSANDAMTALPATLTLANLAGVSMARAADIGTNVLMTFGMKAKDLGGVVDLMATAVNNSNANIEELANSLSYAGPAAQTAGISIQETTAAIETLANAGIKGSRGGSALRRMFVSILNPTKKGQEVIDKYGLSMTDMEGKTRSLVDIVGQLSKALKNVPGPERLAAIQDLVGVYATSPVVALVDNFDKMAEFAGQNENVDGAGAKMEKIISDNMKFDWKELMSALEEVQLQMFDSMNGKIRESIAGWTLDVLKLMEPVKTMMSSSGEEIKITGLDRLIQQAQDAATAVGYLAAAFVGIKFANSGIFTGLSADMGKVSERMTILATRAKITSTGFLVMGSSADGARTRMDMLNLTLGRTFQVGNLAALGLGLVAKAARGLSVALGVLTKLSGVGLIVWGVYEAVSAAFGTDVDESVLAHKESVDEVESSYDKLKRTIEDMGVAKQRHALKDIITSNEEGLQQVTDRKSSNQVLIDTSRARGIPEEDLSLLMKDQRDMTTLQEDYKAKIENAKKALGDMGTTTNDYDNTLADHRATLQDVVNLTDQLTRARAMLAKSSGAGSSFKGLAAADEKNVGRLEQELALAQERSKATKATAVNVLDRVPTVESQIGAAEKDAQAAADAKNYAKLTPISQQLVDNEKAITAEREHQAKLITQDKAVRAGAANGALDAKQVGQGQVGQDVITASVAKLAKLQAARAALTEKEKEQADDLAKTKADAAQSEMSDAAKLVNLRSRLVGINERIASAEAPSNGQAPDLKELNDLYKEQLQYKQGIHSLETKGDKAGTRAENKEAREAEQQAKQDLTTYTALAKKFDAVSASQLELNKGTEAMQRLRAAGTITEDQEDKALGELNLIHYEAVNALDKHYVALEKLRDSYQDSPFGVAANDLAVLNQGLDQGRVSLDEYLRIYKQINTKQKDQATNGLPTADLNVGQASSSPFTDWVSTETNKAKGLNEFSDRQRELDQSLAVQMAANERERQNQLDDLAAKKLNAENHATEMLAIDKKYQDQKSAIQQTAGVQQNAVFAKQAAYADQMGKMSLISAMGSASDILGNFASATADSTAAQKVAFIAQKALAIAQIIMYTQIAAAQALTIPGDPLKVLGLPLATFITATGYANAALVAGLAIGQLTAPASSSSSSSSASTAATTSKSGSSPTLYDTGGYIPYNQFGVVGEYGPELVSGPTHVRGRGSSSAALKSGGGDSSMTVHLAPNFNVTAPDASEDSTSKAREFGDMLSKSFLSHISEATRPGGALDNWYRAKTGR